MESQWDQIFYYLRDKTFPADFTKNQKSHLTKHAKKFRVVDGELFFGNRKAVRERKTAWELFLQFHNAPSGSHAGMIKTRSAICSRFYWLGMTIDIDKWVSKCDACQHKRKVSERDKCQHERTDLPAPLRRESIKVSAVWQLVGIDLTGPLPVTSDGYNYILTATDYFSKWVEAFPLKTKSAAEVTQRLCSLIYRHGCPKRILSDRGQEFVNELNKNLCMQLQLRCCVIAAYHPQANSLDETTNHNLKEAFKTLVSVKQDHWDVHLEPLLFALRSKVPPYIKHTPFLLMYGREAVLPSEVPEDVQLSVELPDEDSYETSLKKRKEQMEKTCRKLKKKAVKSQEKPLLDSDGQEMVFFNLRDQEGKGGWIKQDSSSPCTIASISGKNITLINAEGGDFKTKYSLDLLKPQKRSNTEEDTTAAKRPRVEESTSPKPYRDSVIKYAPPCQLIICGPQQIKAKFKVLLAFSSFTTNPLGGLKEENDFLKKKVDGADMTKWTIRTLDHNSQQSSNSCKVLVFLFPKAFVLKGGLGQIQTVLEEAAKCRLHLPRTLPQIRVFKEEEEEISSD